jgi:ABC-type transporter Mla MlaB component
MLGMSAPPAGPELVLSGPLTVDTVAAARQQMAERLTGDGELIVRAAEVTQLDGAGAQLLHAFLAELARRGRPMRWASASIYLTEAAAVLGMLGCLGLRGLPAEVTSWRP